MKSYIKTLLLGLTVFSWSINAVPMSTVKLSSLPTTVVVDAEVEAITAATVSAQVSARVKRLFVDVNDKVEAGDILVELDDTELRLRLAKAKAAKSVASAQLTQANTEYKRLKGLETQQFVSDQDISIAMSNREVAQAKVYLTQAEIAEVQQLLTYTKITAPYSGVVTARHIEIGEMAAIGAPLLSGFRMNQNRIVAQIPNRLIDGLESQGILTMKTGENNWLKLTDLTIAPNSSADSRSVMVRANVDDSVLKLRAGSLVKVGVVVGYRNALTVPTSAVFYQGDLAAVYVQVADVIALRQVLVGNIDSGQIEILSGLANEDKVVTDSAAYLAQHTATKVEQ